MMLQTLRFGQRVVTPSMRQIIHEMRVLQAEEERVKAAVLPASSTNDASGATRSPEPRPFPAWPDLRREIASEQRTVSEGREDSRDWSELVADMIVGRNGNS